MTSVVTGIRDGDKVPTFTPFGFGKALEKIQGEGFKEVKALRLTQIGDTSGERGKRLSKIQNMSNLKILDLEGPSSLGPAQLAPILRNKHLEELHLHDLPKLESQNGWESILKEDWTKLESLSITGSLTCPGHFPARGLLAILTKGSKIKKLDLSHQETLTDTVLLAIAKACPNLEELTLCGCPNIQIHGLLQLPDHCRNLSRINVARLEAPIDPSPFKTKFPNILVDNENLRPVSRS